MKYAFLRTHFFGYQNFGNRLQTPTLIGCIFLMICSENLPYYRQLHQSATTLFFSSLASAAISRALNYDTVFTVSSSFLRFLFCPSSALEVLLNLTASCKTDNLTISSNPRALSSAQPRSICQFREKCQISWPEAKSNKGTLLSGKMPSSAPADRS